MRAEDLRGYRELLAGDQRYRSYRSYFMLGAIHQVSKSAAYHYSCWPARVAEEFDTLVKFVDELLWTPKTDIGDKIICRAIYVGQHLI